MLHELAEGVRRGRIDPIDLVSESLRRIEAADGQLNAVVALRAEEAMAEAASHPRTGPLAGLPLLVKDMARCKGMRTTYGSTLFANAAPDIEDDIVVARLRAAGAIVVGRTNSPAFGHTAITTNEVFGTTANPWNPERSPGGSSGGSGAAMAAGFTPLATASDGGGSVRIPASACGLVGYKPTMGAIGRNVVPRWIAFSTQGVIGTTVADVVLEASITHGPAMGDVLSLPTGSVPLAPRAPRRVLACRSFRADVDGSIAAAFAEAVATLGAQPGIEVRWLDDDDVPCSADDLATWFTLGTAELAQSLGHVRDQWDGFEASLRFQLTMGERVSAADYIAGQRRRHEVARRIDALLGDPASSAAADTVLVVPTLNSEMWPAAGPMPDFAGAVTGDPTIATNTPEANLTGHPAVSVPCGVDGNGVPFGLQVMGPRFADDLTLGLAAVLERVRPWPLVASGYDTFDAAWR